MSNDGSLANPDNPLHCKIFLATHLKVERQVNMWLKEHSNFYIEHQETTDTPDGLAITIWYTEYFE